MSILLLVSVAASLQIASDRPQLSDASGAALAALEACVIDRSLYLEPSGEEVDIIIRVATHDCATIEGRAEEALLADLQAKFGPTDQTDRAARMTADILAIQQRLTDWDAESKIVAARADRQRQTSH